MNPAQQIERNDFIEVEPGVWEIPSSFRSDMRVPARLYADGALLDASLLDRSIEQLVNTATLPGIVKYAIAMPDIHQGYGFPIGGVIATRLPDGVISPGGVGYDINCGVRVLASEANVDEVQPFLGELARVLYRNCPSGVGVHGELGLNDSELDRILSHGSDWALEQGYARPEDLTHTEHAGKIPGADPKFVSQRARERGRGQIGTLGAGNHFIEVLLQIPFFEERTLLQVFRCVNTFGPEARPQKTLFVKRAVIGGVMQYRAELFELIILNFLDRPSFASHGEFFEFAEPGAVAPAFGQQPIAKSDPVADTLRQALVKAQQRIKPVLETHAATLLRVFSIAPIHPKCGRKENVASISSGLPCQACLLETTSISPG